MSTALLQAFTTALYASQGAGSLYAAVGGKMYAHLAPQDVALPALVYSIDDLDIEHYFGGSYRARAVARVALWYPEGSLAAAFAAENLLYAIVGNATLAAPAGSGLGPITAYCTARSVHTINEDGISVSSTYTLEASTT